MPAVARSTAMIASNFTGTGGMGTYARQLSAALEKAGWQVNRLHEGDGLHSFIATEEPDVWVRHGWAHDRENSFSRADFTRHTSTDSARNVLVFGFDPALLDPGSIDIINGHFETVLADSQWSAARARLSGISAPRICSLPPPIVRMHTQRRKSPGEPYTFIHVANGNPFLKGTDIVLRAFNRAKFSSRSARLIIKLSGSGQDHRVAVQRLLALGQTSKSTNVTFDVGRRPHSQMGDVYGMADCYVHVPRTESLGLPPLEAATLGLKVILHQGGSGPEIAKLVNHFVVDFKVGLLPAGAYRDNASCEVFEADAQALSSTMIDAASGTEPLQASGDSLMRSLRDFDRVVASTFSSFEHE